MLKLNKKGFMMAELIVVSSIILVTMVGMYASFNKIYSVYDTRLSYNDVTTLYKLAYYRDILIENSQIEVLKEHAMNSNVVNVGGMITSGDKVIMVHNNRNKINSNIFDSFSVNTTFKDYVDYLENKIDFSEFEYMMIMERCAIKDDGSVNIDDCSYAYLEIFE